MESHILAGHLGFVEVTVHSLVPSFTSSSQLLEVDALAQLEVHCLADRGGRETWSYKTLSLPHNAAVDINCIEEIMEVKCFSNATLRFLVYVQGRLLKEKPITQDFVLLSEVVPIENIAISSPTKALQASASSQVTQPFHHRLQPLFFETLDSNNEIECSLPSHWCLEVSFTYFPNHISFPFLALSTLSDNKFSIEVCEQMKSLLSSADIVGSEDNFRQSSSANTVAVGSQIDRELLLQAIDKLVMSISDHTVNSKAFL